MGKRITWICDECRHEAEGYILPNGWLEASFYANDRWYRYCFCCYKHLAIWSERRSLHYKQFSKLDSAIHETCNFNIKPP